MSDNSLDYKKFYEEITGYRNFIHGRKRGKGQRFFNGLFPQDKVEYFEYVIKKYENVKYELDHPLLTEEEKAENAEISKKVQEIQNSYLS